MSLEINETAQAYIRLWRRVLVDFLGRSEAELEQLVDLWRDGLASENSMFYHEAPEYYVAPKLLPAIANSLSPHQRSRLCWAIYPVIRSYDRECDLAPECFAALRTELDQTIANWLAANGGAQHDERIP